MKAFPAQFVEGKSQRSGTRGNGDGSRFLRIGLRTTPVPVSGIVLVNFRVSTLMDTTGIHDRHVESDEQAGPFGQAAEVTGDDRSEERRVGKEGGSRGTPENDRA